jgi:hypothetical protein
MQEKITREMGDLKKEFEEYAKTQVDITKLHLAGELSRFLSGFLLKSAILYLLLFVLLFFSIAAAIYIGEIFGWIVYGFAIVGGFYFVATLSVWLLRRFLFERPAIKRFMQLMYPNTMSHEE